jgi:UrcA family protein
MSKLHVSRARTLCSLLGAATLCSLLGAAFSLGVSEDVSAGVPSVTVPYRDLNLSQPADAQLLYQRLRRAADTVCVAVPTYELARHAAYERCFRIVLDRAVMSVGSAELSAIHRAATAGPKEVAATRD